MGNFPWARAVGIALALALLTYFLFQIRTVLPPFLIAFVVAVLLDPVIDRLVRRGWSRRGAVLVVFAVFLLLFFLVALVLIPMAFRQATELAAAVPGYYTTLARWGEQQLIRHHDLLERLGLPASTEQLLAQYDSYQQEIRAFLMRQGTRMLALLGASLGKVVWLAIIPIVSFYLLLDIDAILRRVVTLFPDRYEPRIAAVGRQVVDVFASYLRGLCIVCTLYGLANGLVLALVFHLPYALVLAVISGILYAVPYVGAIATVALGTLVALATPDHTTGFIVAVAVTLLVLNQIFDQLVTPRIVGGLVGLHPALSVFALAAGGERFGLIGMIVAVPLAASVRVILVELFPALTRPLPGDPASKPRKRDRRQGKPPPEPPRLSSADPATPAGTASPGEETGKPRSSKGSPGSGRRR